MEEKRSVGRGFGWVKANLSIFGPDICAGARSFFAGLLSGGVGLNAEAQSTSLEGFFFWQ